MAEPQSELKIIQELSKRIVDAQSNIRILDAIKWDDSIKHGFFKNRCRKLPAVNKIYYQGRP